MVCAKYDSAEQNQQALKQRYLNGKNGRTLLNKLDLDIFHSMYGFKKNLTQKPKTKPTQNSNHWIMIVMHLFTVFNQNIKSLKTD